MARVVLVTGVSRSLGAHVAHALLTTPGVERVVGVDSAPLRYPVRGMEFVRVSAHDNSVAAAVRASGADTVVHLTLAAPESRGGHAVVAGNDVVGTMQLLAACQRSDTVRRVVVRSTAAVYGPVGRMDGLIPATEDLDARNTPCAGRVMEESGVERHVWGLTRRRPDLEVTVLRFANLIGPSGESPLARYFGLSVVPTVRGYDPWLQFLHEDDGVETVRRMALSEAEGVFNVAGRGALSLSWCLRRIGRPGMAVPERGLRVLGTLTPHGRLRAYTPDRQSRLLCYGRVLDSSKLERVLDWRPAHTSAEAFESFIVGRGDGADRPTRLLGQVSHRMRSAVSR